MKPWISLVHGDCLEKMQDIPAGSVDMVATDPPYGTIKGLNSGGWDASKIEWDVEIEHSAMVAEIDRTLRMNGMAAIFCQDPYTAKLMMETHGNLPFCYRYAWVKDHFANATSCSVAPVNYTEDICIFSKRYDTMFLHPLREYSVKIRTGIGKTTGQINQDLGHQGADHFFRSSAIQFTICTEKTYGCLIERYGIDKFPDYKSYQEIEEINRRFKRRFNLPDGSAFKSNILQYKKDYTGLHPTQKPVALMEDLIYTYTNQGETVLDFTMGSGTTGVACQNLGRNFIGIELNKEYFDIAKERILGQRRLF